MSDFHLYLISKKIDPSAFERGDNPLYQEFERAFTYLHQSSFTSQKLFLLNKLRRKFLYENPEIIK
ncbi:MAG: hypothetical protein CBB92_14615 [Flammeovirgaceae bacterium TMED32]|nr:MAG: hypothetical protein CBB92_14615 [Flammeovirgaceae bacterium TMED32]|tara:strand:+ start:1083 stop:1280 length:198 start_codon:yes stop_codon:yes gene_type:complete